MTGVHHLGTVSIHRAPRRPRGGAAGPSPGGAFPLSRNLLSRIGLLAALTACTDYSATPTEPSVESRSALSALNATASAASGSKSARYLQLSVTGYRVTVFGVFIHDFVVMTNSCDGSIVIAGGTPAYSSYYTTETVTGTLTGGKVRFNSVYDGPFSPGFSWSGSFAADTDGPLAGDYPGTVTVTSSSTTDYKNHGEYVANSANKNDAAHACIGRPIP